MIATITFYSVVLFVHIACVVIAFGVTFTYPAIGPWTGKNHPRNAAYFHHLQHMLGQRVITPFATLILLSGIYLAAKSDVYDFGDWWVSFGFASIIVLLGLGGAFFGPRATKLAELAERDGQAGAPSPEYLGLVKSTALVGMLASGLVLATIFVMVMGSRGFLT